MLGNLPSWFLGYWGGYGYDSKVIDRLMLGFYSDATGLAKHSVFDEKTWTVKNHFTTSADTWLEDNARYDPANKKTAGATQSPSPAILFSDEVRMDYQRQLNYKPDARCSDVGSHISGATGKSIGTSTSGGSTVNEESNKMFHTKEMALELANTKRENAELNAKLASLESQMQRLTQAMLGQSAATPSTPGPPSTSTSTKTVYFQPNKYNNNQAMAEQQRHQGSPRLRVEARSPLPMSMVVVRSCRDSNTPGALILIGHWGMQ